ncbi:hypothetical protein E2C01_054912 [Portunus trituberculatus]|uniref:Uncharacterized protein n=1 Tax=Portunus trituberculatus TaxID=210409 RepID=A0A5B7GTB4_PORTR|nr:hypothetical protein [Portunus trituberculatus]
MRPFVGGGHGFRLAATHYDSNYWLIRIRRVVRAMPAARGDRRAISQRKAPSAHSPGRGRRGLLQEAINYWTKGGKWRGEKEGGREHNRGCPDGPSTPPPLTVTTTITTTTTTAHQQSIAYHPFTHSTLPSPSPPACSTHPPQQPQPGNRTATAFPAHSKRPPRPPQLPTTIHCHLPPQSGVRAVEGRCGRGRP